MNINYLKEVRIELVAEALPLITTKKCRDELKLSKRGMNKASS